jgi:TolB-like protein/Tfp pilus assembly protein PilF
VITPFEDLNELSTDSSPARAVTGAFTDALARTKEIRVSDSKTQKADPWSAEDWKKIGEAAGARFVLSGSVREREGKKRVVVHLVETGSGSVVSTWLQDAKSYSDIARISLAKISNLLGAKNTSTGSELISLMAVDGDLNAVGETNNASARSYYARGKELFFRYNLPDQRRAIESFQKALEIDPSYGKAYAMLASACQARARVDPAGGWLERSEAAASTAFRVAPMLADAHRARAGNFQIKGQIQAAIDSDLNAYELDPSDGRTAAAIAGLYDFIGRPDFAIAWFEKATRRENRPVYADSLGEAWADLGDYEKAEKAFNIAADFRPEHTTGAVGLCKLALFRGDYESARRQCELARAKYKDDPHPLMMAALVEFFARRYDAAERLYREASAPNRTGGLYFPGAVRFISALGFMKKLSHANLKEGNALLEESRALDEKELVAAPDNPERLYSLAADQAALGNRDAAISSLGKAIAAGWIDHRSMELDPRFDSIRETPAFKGMVTNIKDKLAEMRRRQASRKLVVN